MIPVIIISNDSDILTKVAAFGMGADDYVSKPIDPSELKARIEARLRWVRSDPQEKSVTEFGDIVRLDSLPSGMVAQKPDWSNESARVWLIESSNST